MISKLRCFLTSLGVGVTLSFLSIFPLKAAEKLYFIYGPLNFSLEIDSLEKFAKTGEVNAELADYFDFVNANAQEQAAFREALTRKVELENPVYISRFFNSPMGEAILERMGYLIEIQGGRNGKYALRGAIVQAALDEDQGLTLMNVLNQLAVNMQFNLDAIETVVGRLQALEKGTRLLVKMMQQLALEEAKETQNINFSTLPNISQPGNYGTPIRQVWTLTDSQRKRTFDVIIYQPQRWREGKTPVVVISHGLASRPQDFEDRAKHLATYGYVVALPEHIDSNFQQVEDLLDGFTDKIFTVDGFINRPKDVSYVIDELEQRNSAEFGGRLDLDNVGVAGHSFGGYTALVLGGATLNFDNLERVCERQLWGPNLSLLLQCRALELPERNYQLEDERVTAIYAANPVSGDIFGAEGLENLDHPVIFIAGSRDPATPAAIEQLRAFVWADSQEKYFALIEGQAHVDFSKLDAQASLVLDSYNDLSFPKQKRIDCYSKVYMLAFFEYYIQNNQGFAPYLTSAFSLYISQSPNEIYVVDKEAVIPLSEIYHNTISQKHGGIGMGN